LPAEAASPLAEPDRADGQADLIEVGQGEEVAAEAPAAAPGPALEEPAATLPCPACGTVCTPNQRYCEDCGWLFTSNGAAAALSALLTTTPVPRGSDMPASTQARLRDRYEIRQMVSERQGTQRFRGFDHSSGQPVVIVATAQAATAQAAEV